MPVFQVLRSFNPIGQGTFVTEHFRHPDIWGGAMVFDAGIARSAKGGKRRAENLVRATLSEKDPVFAIFVSHLDYDHVSLVPYVLSMQKVHYLVVPRFSCEQVGSYLLNFLQQGIVEGISFIRVAYPEYFGGDFENIERPVVIYVDPSGPEDGNRAEIVREDLPLLSEAPRGKTTPVRVRSGSQLNVWGRVSDCAWVVTPFVRENRRSTAIAFWEELAEEYASCIGQSEIQPFFCGERRAYVKLRNFINCALAVDAHKKRKLKDIYKKHWGNVNADSMVIASYAIGRCGQEADCFCAPFLYSRNRWCPMLSPLHPYAAGALYTGDGRAGELPLEVMRRFDPIRESVDSLQVPHHGSASSWDSRFAVENKGKFFFAGYGSYNIYGHPSPLVVREIIQHGGLPYFYNESYPPAVQRFSFY